MDLAALRTEVKARGFDFVSNTRIDTWINRVYQRLCDREGWYFLEATSTGTSPLTVSDLRSVFSVVDSTNENVLFWKDYRTLREMDPALDATGSPVYWYLSGENTITTYPGTTDLSVRYLKVPATLTLDADEPIFPERFHYVIVDGVVVEAYKDSDNMEAVAIARDIFNEEVAEMAAVLLVPNYDSGAEIGVEPFGSTDW